MPICGYAKVSTDGQTVASQVADLRATGAVKVYAETASGAKSNRAELAEVMRVLQSGDVLTRHFAFVPRPNIRGHKPRLRS
jgi:DNA invertase Pin-like site-specific DNA recombinase